MWLDFWFSTADGDGEMLFLLLSSRWKTRSVKLPHHGSLQRKTTIGSCFPSCPRSELWNPWRTCQASHHRQQGKGHTVPRPPWKYHNKHHRQMQPTTSLSLSPPTQSIALEENGIQSTRRGHTRCSFNRKTPIPYLQHLGQVHMSQWSTNQEETLKTSPVRFLKAPSVTLENCWNACWPHASGTTLWINGPNCNPPNWFQGRLSHHHQHSLFIRRLKQKYQQINK